MKPGTPVPNYFSDTITDEEFEKIASGANKGVVLYSKTIDYLEPLNILEVSTLRDRLHYKDLPNIRSIQELRSNLQVIATTWPEFDAIISPAVRLGTNNVRIEMFYSSDDAFKEYVEELIKRGFLLNRFNTIE